MSPVEVGASVVEVEVPVVDVVVVVVVPEVVGSVVAPVVVVVIAPVGARVLFDDLPLPVDWEPVAEGDEWQAARFPIGDGVHFIRSDDPLSVIVYGYDQYVSYGYPGGLNLDVVDPETGKPVMPDGEQAGE